MPWCVFCVTLSIIISLHVPCGTFTLWAMKVIRISLQLTGKVAERYLEYKTWHSDFTPSDSQMAQALILAGLDTWESRTLPTLTHTSKLTTKTHQPK